MILGTGGRPPRAVCPRILLFTAVLLITLAAPAVAADAGADMDWSAEPVPSSSLTDSGWYQLAMEPGARVEQAVSLRNTGPALVELRLAGVDAGTGARGGVSYGPADQPPGAVGTWIELSRDTVVLEPGATEVVAFTVAVPADAPPGTSLGGIAVWAPAHVSTSAADPSGGAAALVSVQTRRVIAVEVALPGPGDAELVIGGVRASARPDGLYLEIDVRNDGHGLTTATGALRVPAAGFASDLAVDTFVPGTAIAYPVKWEGDGDPHGRDVTVELRYGDRATTWSGTVDVQNAVREELTDRQVNQAPGPGGLPVPALLALGILGGLSLAAIASRILPRLRHVQGATPAPPAGTARSRTLGGR